MRSKMAKKLIFTRNHKISIWDAVSDVSMSKIFFQRLLNVFDKIPKEF